MTKLDKLTVEQVERVMSVLSDGFIQVWPDEEIDAEEVTEVANRRHKVAVLKKLHGESVIVYVYTQGLTVFGHLEVEMERTRDIPNRYFTYTFRVPMSGSGNVEFTFGEDDVVDVETGGDGPAEIHLKRSYGDG